MDKGLFFLYVTLYGVGKSVSEEELMGGLKGVVKQTLRQVLLLRYQ